MTLPVLEDGPADACVRLVLAHGAGAPMRSPFMQCIAEAVAARGVRVVRFEFPYMREGGKRPDPPAVLRDTWREVVSQLGGGADLHIGGKSMGGRIASMVADEVGARGLVCLGYPFHPAGAPERTRVAHLRTLQTPALFVQGTRDALGSREEVEGYRGPNSELWFDLTCIHPNPTGHAKISEMFAATVNE